VNIVSDLVVEAPACRRTREVVSLALDGETETLEMRAATLHLDRCERCRRFAADVAAITEALRAPRFESGSAATERRRGERS
jgi:predicted anti-sigma-YlaC factor YlaD